MTSPIQISSLEALPLSDLLGEGYQIRGMKETGVSKEGTMQGGELC